MAPQRRGGTDVTLGSTEVNAPEEGFLDIAANALAVILFVTMMLLITISASSDGRPMPEHDQAVTLPEPKLGVIGSFRHYYVVSDAGLTRIDLSPVFEGFFAGQRRVSTDLAEAWLTIDRQGQSARDLNAFSATITLGPASVAEAAWPLHSQPDVNTALARIETALREEQAGALTILIAPGGTMRLAPLFHLVEQAEIPLRIAPMPQDWSIEIRRKAIDFNARLRER